MPRSLKKGPFVDAHLEKWVKRAKDGTHISSKMYTYSVCIISILISAYLIYNKIQ